MHLVATTSREAYRTLDASSLYALILGHMREGGEHCIADLAHDLNLERSTVSARMNELRNSGRLEYTGKKRSRATGVMAMHFKVKLQDSLF